MVRVVVGGAFVALGLIAAATFGRYEIVVAQGGSPIRVDRFTGTVSVCLPPTGTQAPGGLILACVPDKAR